MSYPSDVKEAFSQVHKTETQQVLHWLAFSFLVAITAQLMQIVMVDAFLKKGDSLGLYAVGLYAVALFASAALSTILWSFAFAFAQSFKYIDLQITRRNPKKNYGEVEIAYFYSTWPSWIVRVFAPAIFMVSKSIFTGSV